MRTSVDVMGQPMASQLASGLETEMVGSWAVLLESVWVKKLVV